MKNTKIGWCHHTKNFWWGCNKISEACRHCYIDRIMRRSGHMPFNGPIRTSIKSWQESYKWDRRLSFTGERERVFTCSMSDFFHPGADAWREEAWEVMRACSNLDWLVLTKRPELIPERLPHDWGSAGYPNVWLGVTVERQDYLERVRQLLVIPAMIHFVSAEPLLGPLNFGPQIVGLDWVIVGCEQAHKDERRPMCWDWVRGIRNQCLESETAMFLKQYYIGNQLQFDGLLDGRAYLDWPTPCLN